MVVASLVAWLADDKATVDRIDGIGRLVNEEVFGRRLRAFAEERAATDPDFAEFGRTVAGHFWCDLLVETANALSRGAELVGRVPGGVVDAVLEHEDASQWSPVRRKLAEAASGFLWKCLQTLVGVDPQALILQLRVLAVLICPDPGGHPRVARHCLRPLATDNLREYLQVNVDPEWLWRAGDDGEAVVMR